VAQQLKEVSCRVCTYVTAVVLVAGELGGVSGR